MKNLIFSKIIFKIFNNHIIYFGFRNKADTVFNII